MSAKYYDNPKERVSPNISQQIKDMYSAEHSNVRQHEGESRAKQSRNGSRERNYSSRRVSSKHAKGEKGASKNRINSGNRVSPGNRIVPTIVRTGPSIFYSNSPNCRSPCQARRKSPDPSKAIVHESQIVSNSAKKSSQRQTYDIIPSRSLRIVPANPPVVKPFNRTNLVREMGQPVVTSTTVGNYPQTTTVMQPSQNQLAYMSQLPRTTVHRGIAQPLETSCDRQSIVSSTATQRAGCCQSRNRHSPPHRVIQDFQSNNSGARQSSPYNNFIREKVRAIGSLRT